jgi:hypothetical protein
MMVTAVNSSQIYEPALRSRFIVKQLTPNLDRRHTRRPAIEERPRSLAVPPMDFVSKNELCVADPGADKCRRSVAARRS